MPKNTSVMGLYPDHATVSDAINVLQKEGYRATDISVLSADNQGTKDFALEKRDKAAAGAATGTAIGAALGAAVTWLISVQTSTTPALMPLVTAGPFVAALAGAGAGGTVGFVAGMLAGLRQIEYVARRYAGRIRRGGILLSVHCDGPTWQSRASETLVRTGARSVSAAAEAAADYGTTDKPTERSPGPPAAVLEPPVDNRPELNSLPENVKR
jgi:hypothetical protein